MQNNKLLQYIFMSFSMLCLSACTHYIVKPHKKESALQQGSVSMIRVADIQIPEPQAKYSAETIQMALV